jgi:hypothetical protein
MAEINFLTQGRRALNLDSVKLEGSCRTICPTMLSRQPNLDTSELRGDRRALYPSANGD